MAVVHYKFKNSVEYDSISFDGLSISLRDLKKTILLKKKMRPEDTDLQVVNAQTNEAYTSENMMIPKNTSLIIARIPVGAVKKPLEITPQTKARKWAAFRQETQAAIREAESGFNTEKLKQGSDLVNAQGSESDKIAAMMRQSTKDFDPANYQYKVPTGTPSSSYICFRCGKPGHFLQNCPMEPNDPEANKTDLRMKKPTGIPIDQMMLVSEALPGTYKTHSGHFVVPVKDAVAYATGKKERPPFLPEEKPKQVLKKKPVPNELKCPLCGDIAKDAVVIPCCGISYCDECIRNKLLETDDHVCPSCDSMDVSPDGLIANQMLRRAVTNFQNERGYMKVSSAQQSATKQTAQKPRAAPPPRPAAIVPRGPSVLDYRPPPAPVSSSQVTVINIDASVAPSSHLPTEPPTPTQDEPPRSSSAMVQSQYSSNVMLSTTSQSQYDAGVSVSQGEMLNTVIGVGANTSQMPPGISAPPPSAYDPYYNATPQVLPPVVPPFPVPNFPPPSIPPPFVPPVVNHPPPTLGAPPQVVPPIFPPGMPRPSVQGLPRPSVPGLPRPSVPPPINLPKPLTEKEFMEEKDRLRREEMGTKSDPMLEFQKELEKKRDRKPLRSLSKSRSRSRSRSRFRSRSFSPRPRRSYSRSPSPRRYTPRRSLSPRRRSWTPRRSRSKSYGRFRSFSRSPIRRRSFSRSRSRRRSPLRRSFSRSPRRRSPLRRSRSRSRGRLSPNRRSPLRRSLSRGRSPLRRAFSRGRSPARFSPNRRRSPLRKSPIRGQRPPVKRATRSPFRGAKGKFNKGRSPVGTKKRSKSPSKAKKDSKPAAKDSQTIQTLVQDSVGGNDRRPAQYVAPTMSNNIVVNLIDTSVEDIEKDQYKTDGNNTDKTDENKTKHENKIEIENKVDYDRKKEKDSVKAAGKGEKENTDNIVTEKTELKEKSSEEKRAEPKDTSVSKADKSTDKNKSDVKSDDGEKKFSSKSESNSKDEKKSSKHRKRKSPSRKKRSASPSSPSFPRITKPLQLENPVSRAGGARFSRDRGQGFRRDEPREAYYRDGRNQYNGNKNWGSREGYRGGGDFRGRGRDDFRQDYRGTGYNASRDFRGHDITNRIAGPNEYRAPDMPGRPPMEFGPVSDYRGPDYRQPDFRPPAEPVAPEFSRDYPRRNSPGFPPMGFPPGFHYTGPPRDPRDDPNYQQGQLGDEDILKFEQYKQMYDYYNRTYGFPPGQTTAPTGQTPPQGPPPAPPGTAPLPPPGAFDRAASPRRHRSRSPLRSSDTRRDRRDHDREDRRDHDRDRDGRDRQRDDHRDRRHDSDRDRQDDRHKDSKAQSPEKKPKEVEEKPSKKDKKIKKRKEKGEGVEKKKKKKRDKTKTKTKKIKGSKKGKKVEDSSDEEEEEVVVVKKKTKKVKKEPEPVSESSDSVDVKPEKKSQKRRLSSAARSSAAQSDSSDQESSSEHEEKVEVKEEQTKEEGVEQETVVSSSVSEPVKDAGVEKIEQTSDSEISQSNVKPEEGAEKEKRKPAKRSKSEQTTSEHSGESAAEEEVVSPKKKLKLEQKKSVSVSVFGDKSPAGSDHTDDDIPAPEDELMLDPPEISKWEKEDDPYDLAPEPTRVKEKWKPEKQTFLPRSVIEKAEKNFSQKVMKPSVISSAVAVPRGKEQPSLAKETVDVVKEKEEVVKKREKSPVVEPKRRVFMDNEKHKDERRVQAKQQHNVKITVSSAHEKRKVSTEGDLRNKLSKRREEDRSRDYDRYDDRKERDEDRRGRDSHKDRRDSRASREYDRQDSRGPKGDSSHKKKFSRKDSVADESKFVPDYDDSDSDDRYSSSSESSSEEEVRKKHKHKKNKHKKDKKHKKEKKKEKKRKKHKLEESGKVKKIKSGK